MANTESSMKRPPRQRSPSYPAINLISAIEKAQQFYNAERRNSANIDVAAKHWGFKSSSSGGALTIAALISFGLLRDSGTGKNRHVQLTDLALNILLDKREGSPEREEAIKKAALMPKIHKEIFAKWATLPSDENLKHYLVMERKFNENTVGDFVQKLKDTVSFAKLTADHYTEAEAEAEEEFVGEEPGSLSQMPTLATPREKATNSNVLDQVTQGAPKGKQVGASIPVTKNCSMSIVAEGDVTQEGLDRLIAYLNLIKVSFPEK